jgi:hypothetical protein
MMLQRFADLLMMCPERIPPGLVSVGLVCATTFPSGCLPEVARALSPTIKRGESLFGAFFACFRFGTGGAVPICS